VVRISNSSLPNVKERKLIQRRVVIFGPAATKWYGLLTKHVNLNSKNGTIVARVACDQLLFAPVNMGSCSPSPSPFPSYTP
jgi:hypothetical protein